MTDQAKHAPAPWTVTQESTHRPTQIHSGKLLLADVYGEAREQREATAKVMAAGPETLAALNDAVRELHNLTRLGRTEIDDCPECDWDRLYKAIQKGEAAIAKARAKQ